MLFRYKVWFCHFQSVENFPHCTVVDMIKTVKEAKSYLVAVEHKPKMLERQCYRVIDYDKFGLSEIFRRSIMGLECLEGIWWESFVADVNFWLCEKYCHPKKDDALMHQLMINLELISLKALLFDKDNYRGEVFSGKTGSLTVTFFSGAKEVNSS